jgi:hypothetical protein
MFHQTIYDGGTEHYMYGVPVQVDYIGYLSTQPGEQKGVQEGQWQYVSSYLCIHMQGEDK